VKKTQGKQQKKKILNIVGTVIKIGVFMLNGIATFPYEITNLDRTEGQQAGLAIG
jgi:hypothetical protein